MQSAISGLRSVNTDENHQRPIADGRLVFQCDLRDQRRRIGRSTHLFSQPLGFVFFLRVTKKVVNVLDSWPGENSLTANAAIFLRKIAQQLHLELISGCEVGMPALAREWMVPEPIPIKARDSKAGPRRDHRAIAFCIFGSFAERNEIFRFESIDSVGVSFEVVDESYRIQLELPAQLTGINDPGEIRDFAAAGSYWTCDAEASALHRYLFGSDEVGDDFGQAAVFLAHVDFFDHLLEFVALSFESGQPGARSADFTSENHASIFLHSRSSRSISSSASFGPHVPPA